jgi:hypothetical protein
VFTSGVSNSLLTPNPTTGRIPTEQLQRHIADLKSSGIIKPRPTLDGSKTNMEQRVSDDKELATKIQREYCFYEGRYKYALRQFLEKATSGNSADDLIARSSLEKSVSLNKRLNSIIEIMNYLAQERVGDTNALVGDINANNTRIVESKSRLMSQYAGLRNDELITKTQKEMVRYTTEKNNHIANQISVWTALNVLALATIYYVYRN